MSIEVAKKKAAYMAVDEFVSRDNMRLGIGSGSTVVYVIERLAQRVKEEGLKNITCVPTSFQSGILLAENGLKVSSLNDCPELDLTIDGADEVDKNLQLIKGGGACQLQEKMVAANSTNLIVVADYRKESQTLGENWKKGIPIEVIPLGYIPVMKQLEKLGGKPKLRMGTAETKAGPVVSDNGNFILDVDFGLIHHPAELDKKIKMIPGVVESGLFIDLAIKAFFGQNDGTVTTRTKP